MPGDPTSAFLPVGSATWDALLGLGAGGAGEVTFVLQDAQKGPGGRRSLSSTNTSYYQEYPTGVTPLLGAFTAGSGIGNLSRLRYGSACRAARDVHRGHHPVLAQ